MTRSQCFYNATQQPMLTPAWPTGEVFTPSGPAVADCTHRQHYVVMIDAGSQTSSTKVITFEHLQSVELKYAQKLDELHLEQERLLDEIRRQHSQEREHLLHEHNTTLSLHSTRERQKMEHEIEMACTRVRREMFDQDSHNRTVYQRLYEWALFESIVGCEREYREEIIESHADIVSLLREYEVTHLKLVSLHPMLESYEQMLTRCAVLETSAQSNEDIVLQRDVALASVTTQLKRSEDDVRHKELRLREIVAAHEKERDAVKAELEAVQRNCADRVAQLEDQLHKQMLDTVNSYREAVEAHRNDTDRRELEWKRTFEQAMRDKDEAHHQAIEILRGEVQGWRGGGYGGVGDLTTPSLPTMDATGVHLAYVQGTLRDREMFDLGRMYQHEVHQMWGRQLFGSKGNSTPMLAPIPSSSGPVDRFSEEDQNDVSAMMLDLSHSLATTVKMLKLQNDEDGDDGSGGGHHHRGAYSADRVHR
eukprot:PhF_6_TR7930/c2_g1_i3/m.11898